MLAKHVKCHVRRDMAEIIPVTCFEHEVEILKDVHGEGAVEIIDSLPDVKPVDIDSSAEMDRLMNAYGMTESGQPHAERVFGRSARGLEAHAHRPAKKAAGPAKKAAEEQGDED